MVKFEFISNQGFNAFCHPFRGEARAANRLSVRASAPAYLAEGGGAALRELTQRGADKGRCCMMCTTATLTFTARSVTLERYIIM
jgi:hypothetical protein